MGKTTRVNFQAESKKSGDAFEDLVLEDLRERGFEAIQRNVYIEGVGCEVDFLADELEYVEAKGGVDTEGKRPGAKRTDNVKKAIANAALIKTKLPNIYYVIYFSSRPNPGSYSQQMLNTAIGHGIVNEIRYLDGTPKKTINDIIKEIKEQDQELLDRLAM